MNKEIVVQVNCYNHYALDLADTVKRLTDAAHTHDRVIIDTITEAYDIRLIPWKGLTKLLDVLKDLCDSNKWPYTKFHLKSWNPVQNFDTWPSMDRRWCSSWFTRVAKKSLGNKGDKIIEKHFGIFIGHSNWSRLWLSAYLQNKYASKTDQTFNNAMDDPGRMANMDLDAMLFEFSKSQNSSHIDLVSIQSFMDKIPLTKSSVLVGGDTIVADDIMDRYNHIFCEVVCETQFSGECFAMDEKVARSLYTETPFLLMGPINYLRRLRSLGFKTFNEFWSETYDHCSDAVRCIMLSNVVDKLAVLSLSEINELYAKMRPILKHNKERYLELCAMPSDSLEKMVTDTINTV